MSRSTVFVLATFAFAAFAIFGCKKKEGTATPTAAPPAPAAPAPSSASTVAPATSTPAAAGQQATADTTAKLAGTEWALKQDAIKHDPGGQWAIAATASSSYNDAKGNDSWSANQVTGAPNVEKYGDDGQAWAPKQKDAGIEWLDLKYPKPVYATEVRVRESFGSGAVVRVELFDDKGDSHLVWGGNDPTRDLNYMLVKFPKTAYKTDHVKITLATNVVPGWNEIDAVQLVGKDL
jgi:hypothetical protein